jgi:lipopolysaccharide heptosyltransferase II
MPQVAEIVPVPFAHGGLQWRERRQVARQLQGRFDCAYVLPNSLKSALVPWWADIPRRVGYLGEARVGLLTHRLKNPSKGRRPPMVALYSALSGQTDVLGDRPQLRWDAQRSAASLRERGLSPRSYVVLAPGAEYGAAKRWPASHFAQVAREQVFDELAHEASAVAVGERDSGVEHRVYCGLGVGRWLSGFMVLSQNGRVITAPYFNGDEQGGQRNPRPRRRGRGRRARARRALRHLA